MYRKKNLNFKTATYIVHIGPGNFYIRSRYPMRRRLFQRKDDYLQELKILKLYSYNVLIIYLKYALPTNFHPIYALPMHFLCTSKIAGCMVGARVGECYLPCPALSGLSACLLVCLSARLLVCPAFLSILDLWAPPANL